MKYYVIPDGFDQEIDEFEKALQNFQAGELHPTRFRAIRVPFGVYEQRTKNTFMIRVRATGGGVTPRQLIRLSELAGQHGKPIVHATTRQALQLHDINLDDIPEILRELHKVGISSRGGGGNTVRNIMASHDSGIHPDEIFDVTPHAVALGSKLINEDDSWSFPRKYKISFSSREEDNALAAFNDLGFIATLNEGKKGFTVYVAGGLGCRPRLSKVLHEFIAEEDVYRVCAAIKQLYLEYGNRKTKNSGRLRFLWEELGREQFLELYTRYLLQLGDLPPLPLDPEQLQGNGPERIGISPRTIRGKHYELWKTTYVTNQKQRGLKSVIIPLRLGDISTDDGIRLGKFLDRFGENSLRFTMSQNIQVRNLPEPYLGNLYELVSEIETLSHLPKICGEIIACTGANTCTTGVCLPQGLVPVLQKYVDGSGFKRETTDLVKINISGCPNSCGQHHVADLGFYGRVARKNGKSLPGYWVTGGASLLPSTRSFTEKCGWVAARDLPQLLVDILSDFELKRESRLSFKEYFTTGGKQTISALCSAYTKGIPEYRVDSTYFYDWGSNVEFTTAHMGHGECSAGIYDMIEVAMNSINEQLSAIASLGDNEARANVCRDLVYNASSMLLVTRGIDPVNEIEIFSAFEKYFINTGLVDATYRDLVQAALKDNDEFLGNNLERGAALGKAMIQLYHGMDSSLTFKCEVNQTCNAEQQPRETKAEEIHFADLRGVACPMNFVKTKVALAGIKIGEQLKILLDDGEPIDNVPRSVKTEGHEIMLQEQQGSHWRVIIRKSE